MTGSSFFQKRVPDPYEVEASSSFFRDGALPERSYGDSQAAVRAFFSVYYGAYPSDPTENPFGEAPTQGDLYFNTTTQLLRIYTATGWQNLDAAPSDHTHTIANVTGLQAALDGKVNISPQNTLAGAMQMAVVPALPASPDPNTIYVVTG